MVKLNHHITTIVRAITDETDRIRVFELADPDEWELPAFSPGAHIDVHLPNGMVRQYSLCGRSDNRKRYTIAVQREPAGRGGSLCVHRDVTVGNILPVSLPRNHFPLATEATRHLFIAGGIGVTPFVPMVENLAAEAAAFELHYCTRDPADTAFRTRLRAAANDRVVFHYDGGEPTRGLDVPALIARTPNDAHIYCCGPTGLMQAVERAVAGRQPGTVHFEHFGAAISAAAVADRAYDIELARSRRTIPVAAGQSMLVALRAAGVEVEASCEAGVCLTCKTRYVDGVPLHRDLLLKPEERRSFLTPCVSGCIGDRIVLDL